MQYAVTTDGRVSYSEEKYYENNNFLSKIWKRWSQIYLKYYEI